jgi:hypothetical protein
MAQWVCPACNFTVDGEEEEVDKAKMEHMEENADDEMHKQVSEMTPEENLPGTI